MFSVIHTLATGYHMQMDREQFPHAAVTYSLLPHQHFAPWIFPGYSAPQLPNQNAVMGTEGTQQQQPCAMENGYVLSSPELGYSFGYDSRIPTGHAMVHDAMMEPQVAELILQDRICYNREQDASRPDETYSIFQARSYGASEETRGVLATECSHFNGQNSKNNSGYVMRKYDSQRFTSAPYDGLANGQSAAPSFVKVHNSFLINQHHQKGFSIQKW